MTKRDRILDAAERLMGRLGYQKMTMDDIAPRRGSAGGRSTCTSPARKQMALATIDRIVDRLKSRLGELAASDLPWDERLRRMLLVRVLFRFDSVRDYYHSIDEIFRSLRPAYMARRARYFAEEAAIFAAVLGRPRRRRVRARRSRRHGGDAVARDEFAAALEPEHPRAGRAGGGRGPRRAHRRSAAEGPEPRADAGWSDSPPAAAAADRDESLSASDSCDRACFPVLPFETARGGSTR